MQRLCLQMEMKPTSEECYSSNSTNIWAMGRDTPVEVGRPVAMVTNSWWQRVYFDLGSRSVSDVTLRGADIMEGQIHKAQETSWSIFHPGDPSEHFVQSQASIFFLLFSTDRKHFARCWPICAPHILDVLNVCFVHPIIILKCVLVRFT